MERWNMNNYKWKDANNRKYIWAKRRKAAKEVSKKYFKNCKWPRVKDK